VRSVAATCDKSVKVSPTWWTRLLTVVAERPAVEGATGPGDWLTEAPPSL